MKKESMATVDSFLCSARTEFNKFIDNISGETFKDAADLILESQKNHGRLHITGIGKPGHVANYAASLLSSTGNPTYFLHGTEAVHGSCGQLVAGDVVIAISNSGETQELKATVNAVHNNGCKVIGISGGRGSWLAQHSDCFLFAGVAEEGGPLNRAPRNSINAEMLVIEALSVALQVEQNWDPIRYVRCHPGGKLGEIRENEK
ncbi:MAG: SIS domain-containing protein [Bacteroidales bacterium]|nr:SIS domain-containing protein [Bacteroidales bacterium]